MRWPIWRAITWSIEIPARMFGGALLQADAGQERAVAARVVAGAVGAAVGRPVVQAAEDLDHALERLQRLEGPVELEVGPLAGRPPGGGDGAVGEVDEGRPQRRARGGRGQAAGRRRRRAAGARPATRTPAARSRRRARGGNGGG